MATKKKDRKKRNERKRTIGGVRILLMMLLLFSRSIFMEESLFDGLPSALMHACMCPSIHLSIHPFARSLARSQLDQFVFGKVVVIRRGSLGTFVLAIGTCCIRRRRIRFRAHCHGLDRLLLIVIVCIDIAIIVVAIISIITIIVDDFAKDHPDGHVRVDLLGTTAGRIDVAFFPRLNDPSGPALPILTGGSGPAPNVLHNLDGVSHREPIAAGPVPHRKGGRSGAPSIW